MVLRQRRRSGCGQPWLCCYWRVGSMTRQETSRASSMGMVTPGLDSERRNRICRQRSRGSRPTWSTCCPLCHSKRDSSLSQPESLKKKYRTWIKSLLLQGGRDLKYRTWNRLSPVICLGEDEATELSAQLVDDYAWVDKNWQKTGWRNPEAAKWKAGQDPDGFAKERGLMRLGGGPLSGRKRGRRSWDRIRGPARTAGR